MTRHRPKSHDLAQVGLASRRAATDIIEAVVDKGRVLDDLFDAQSGMSAFRTLITKDRALARAIVGTALRRRGQIDDALSRLIDKPLPEKASRIRHVLHVAAAQILFMDVADHAAVSLAVTIAGSERQARPWKNLVNGVARNLVRQRDDIIAGQDAEKLNTPAWLWDRWVAAYGETETRRMAAMHMVEPSLDLTVPANSETWDEKLDAERLPTGSLRLIPKGSIETLDGFADGAWWVQDAAAAIPARLLGDVAGKHVADLCAAPGGKTAQLAAVGAHVTACDLSEARLSRLSENLGRLKLSAKTVQADILTWQPSRKFDAILLDAPCTSTGTIRRHPDIAVHKRQQDVVTMAKTQAAMLDRALNWITPGGLLVYCTCSLEPEEGEAQIAALLERNHTVARVPIEPDEVGGLDEIVTPLGDLRTLPSHLTRSDTRMSGLDGFFAARLRINESF